MSFIHATAWYFGRNGWCNGQDVKPLTWDITKDIEIGSTNVVKYTALAYPDGNDTNGTNVGCNGNIRQSSFLIFHQEIFHQETEDDVGDWEIERLGPNL